jgi:hypothetical protein
MLFFTDCFNNPMFFVPLLATALFIGEVLQGSVISFKAGKSLNDLISEA